MPIGATTPGHVRPHRYGLVPALVAVAILLGPTPAVADSPKLVVVLYPDESDGAPGTIAVNRAIRATFAGQSAWRIDVRNEYVDTSRSRDAEFVRAQVALLRQKYAGRKVDLVIAGLSSGLDFALDHRAELFPAVPIVFVAVDHREVAARRLPPDAVGVPVRMDLAATLDLAMRLHPDTRRVVVVTGAAPFDRHWEEEARRTFVRYADRVEFDYLVGLPMDELLWRVADLPDRSIVYYLNISRDGAGMSWIPAEALERLATRANAPIYGHADTFVGRGIVGGHVFSFEVAGAHAARLGLRLLDGERPESIPIPDVSDNADVFDGRQLRRWGIDERDLPAGSVIRYQEATFWHSYRWHVIGAVSVCVVEALLIVGLLVQRVKRRRADERFRQVVETAPSGMVLVGRDGRIESVNAQAEKLFGYPRTELVGRQVELLVPGGLGDWHASDVGRCAAASKTHFAAPPGDRVGRRKDGTEFPIELGLSPLSTARGLFVLASIIDLSERRRAEQALRESEARFRVMADAAPILIWTSGVDKGCSYFNRPWLEFTGRTLEAELGDGWTAGVHPDDLSVCLETYTKHFDGRLPFEMVYRLRRHDGEYRWVLDRGVPRVAADGEFAGYIGACSDVTERRRAEDGLRASQQELQQLTGRLLEAQEGERRRVARELHDDLNQGLALLAVELDLLAQAPPVEAARTTSRVRELSVQVRELSSSVHDLSHQLHPSKLEQLGLVAAVRGLCKEVGQHHGLSVVFAHDDVPRVVPDATALCLYRIAQEALRNVVRHSGADRARVELTGTREGIRLRVTDTGDGFDPGASNGTGGLGLVSMRERLNLVGGEIRIEARPAAGTRIDVRVPLARAAGADDRAAQPAEATR